MRLAFVCIFGILISSTICLPNYKRLTEESKRKETIDIQRIFFKDCLHSTCHDKIYRGYSCDKGYCKKVCDYDRCWENDIDFHIIDDVNSEDILFDGCKKDTCHKGNYRGYNCHHQRCGKICDFEKCWKPERKPTFVKAVIKSKIIFNDCHEEICHRDKYYGYNCEDGYCTKVCDEHHCWEPEYDNDIEIIFDGCLKETCHKEQYYGYECDNGYCLQICDSKKCWNPKHGRKLNKILFNDCHEHICKNENYHGYDCSDGYCDNICDDKKCWKQHSRQSIEKTKLSTNVIFKGCTEDECHEDNYYGYDCRGGYCRRVCDEKKCWKTEHNLISKRKMMEREILFAGCKEESCHDDQYYGYDCQKGYCDKVCDDQECWRSEYEEVSSNLNSNRVVIFDGCSNKNCENDEYYGYNCDNGYCIKVCNEQKCWEQNYERTIEKAIIEDQVIFRGCHENECRRDQYYGYDCHEGYCDAVCDNQRCWKPKYEHFSGRENSVADVIFEGCEEVRCYKDQYYGNNCHHGYCTHVCNDNKCWEQKKSSMYSILDVEKEIIFAGCSEDNCHEDQHYGYDCQKGYCRKICDENKCWEPKYIGITKKVEIKTNIIFEDCKEEKCQDDHFYGYNCANGYCSSICDHHTCWKPSFEKFAGKAKNIADVVFDGCLEDTCHREDYYGYNCFDGFCDKVCDEHKCWEPKYESETKLAKIEADIIFEGCYEEDCHNSKHYGYDCHNGYCEKVCDAHQCWHPEYRADSGSSKLALEIYFEGCVKEDCKKDHYYGYECFDGYCGEVCDEQKCWKPEYEKVYGYAKVEADIIFKSCQERTCRDEKYFGYDCNDGYCGKVCDHHECWEPKYKSISKKSTVNANIIFTECVRESCHKDNYYGYDCHDGYCGKVCDEHRCWEPEYKRVSKRARVEIDVIFEGCNESHCRDETYFGYDCNDGYCGKVCDDNKCWGPKFQSVSEKANLVADITFDNCVSESCQKGDYYGYDCHDGFCGKVCDEYNCWKPEYKKVFGRTRVETEVIFEGCYEKNCRKENYFGYECNDGYCDRVCDEIKCWKQEQIKISGRATFKVDVIFKDCYEDECEDQLYHGYDCYYGYCGRICKAEECWEPNYEKMLGEKRRDVDIFFNNCHEKNCHQNQYFGYDCHKGYCKKICDINKCWEPQYYSNKNHLDKFSEIVFTGCYEEECKRNQYYGYNCHDGYCAKVCDYDKCWEPKYISSKVNDIVFDGCADNSCSRGFYRGYNCQYGRCQHLCDFDKCWDHQSTTVSEKSRLSSKIIFENCFEVTCKNAYYQGYDCQDGHCDFICDEQTCLKQ